MTERGVTIIFCRILAPPQCPPTTYTPPTPQYVLILMAEERGRHYLLVGFWRPPPPQCPTPSPDATILNNLNDRKGAPLCL